MLFRSSMPCLQIPLTNASSAALRLPSHGSGPGWFATPSPYDSFIRYSKPVYPGAIRSNSLGPRPFSDRSTIAFIRLLGWLVLETEEEMRSWA